jgi:hypothetical protein
MIDLPSEWDVKLKAGKQMVPVRISREGARLLLKFGFNRTLLDEVKQMEGARWLGREESNPRKVWAVADSERNHFQLAYLAHPGASDPENPYNWYDRPLAAATPSRSLYLHQVELFRHGLTYHYCIMAAEMGTGKTLAVWEVIEASRSFDTLYVGPKPALVSARLEYKKWGCKFPVVFVTYDGLKKLVAEWPAGKRAPQFVVFDESSRIKNWTAQRTKAAAHLAEAVRRDWGRDGFVILMSGSPAPKSPVDWWSQCEVACPGFLREGSPEKEKQRLAVIETRESFAGGGAYPNLVTWRDDERKCRICGLLPEAETHTGEIDVMATTPTTTYHPYEKGVNEVDLLYKRMRGLVMVKFKRDCLDLPEKIYREVVLDPNRSILNAASAIAAKAPNAITCMTLLRELSDGFQYVDRVTGSEECSICRGSKEADEPIFPDQYEVTERDLMRGWTETEMGEARALGITFQRVACSACSGTGKQDRVERTVVEVPTPKEAALVELLDECEDAGRIVVYGGFTGSIDRIAKVVSKQQWHWIRADGRGWVTNLPYTTPEKMIEAFQCREAHSRVAFIGHPASAGMGLTLTASPLTCYWSNDFNAESRIQSEDRIHRPGMDHNRGATIVDLLHLPTDLRVLNNLKKKRRLQDISMGELRAVLAQAEANAERST